MLRSNLYDHADAYILVKETITISGEGNDTAARQAYERNKGVTFKNCAPFTKCISRINKKDIDTAQDIDIIMLMYNLIIMIIIQKQLEVDGNITEMILMIT